MNLRTAIIRDLKTGPTTIKPLAKRLPDHSTEQILLELQELQQDGLVEILVALENIHPVNVYRITEKGFQS